jgi:hypothetical protein
MYDEETCLLAHNLQLLENCCWLRAAFLGIWKLHSHASAQKLKMGALLFGLLLEMHEQYLISI